MEAVGMKYKLVRCVSDTAIQIVKLYAIKSVQAEAPDTPLLNPTFSELSMTSSNITTDVTADGLIIQSVIDTTLADNSDSNSSDAGSIQTTFNTSAILEAAPTYSSLIRSITFKVPNISLDAMTAESTLPNVALSTESAVLPSAAPTPVDDLESVSHRIITMVDLEDTTQAAIGPLIYLEWTVEDTSELNVNPSPPFVDITLTHPDILQVLAIFSHSSIVDTAP